MAAEIYRTGLERVAANHQPLTPVSFLSRSAAAYPRKIAVIDGDRRITYRELEARCRRLASALLRRGITAGDTVAILAPNVPAMLEAHYGVPMMGAVLNALNIRLDVEGLAFCLRHAEAKLLIVDREWLAAAREAVALAGAEVPLVVICDGADDDIEERGYEAFLCEGNDREEIVGIDDEWSAISLGYTSGTTGNPKGVVCHHRGAYLNALGNALAARLDDRSVYLWTLPMFHCNGWSHTWAVTAVGGTHVCLRRIDIGLIRELIEREGVTHMSAAPVVLNMIAAADDPLPRGRSVRILTGGAAPPSAVMAAMERLGYAVMHIYGMTESTGPSLICEWQPEWDELPDQQRRAMNARQGVRLVTMGDAIVARSQDGRPVRPDGREMGEILVRGNTVMMGYLKNPQATEEALADGWLHTGDLAVTHPDGYIEIKDRSKDIIISGGENISSVEVEEILYRHPAVYEVAVVSRPDRRWGEHPCAFVDLKPAAEASADALREFCRANMAGFKVPKTFVFGPLPKNATGKILKQALRERAQAMVETAMGESPQRSEVAT
jgi:fatty-acyl-CoA synthase